MHHYPFHVGDYTLATLHLEDRQDLCYRRLLDAYYLDGGPLADAKQTLSRRVRTDEQTLSEVLTEFFVLVDGYWHHARCDREIERYKAKSEKAKIAGSLGGKSKSSERKANAKQTPSKRLANQNQEPEPRTSKSICTLDEAISFAVELGLPASDGEACFHKWEGNGWTNGGKKIKDWKATIRSWNAAGYLPSQKGPSTNQGQPTQAKFKLVC
jgi:uncharacterized protein YdaU (DUF1376 family)